MATADKATDTQLMNGADILVKSLVDHDVDVLFAYPGGASMPLHQALRKNREQIRTILPRHEQGGGFAAQGVARSTGRVGVCMATSGPGATNAITGIATAYMDSIPMVVISGQVPNEQIGTDAFQETDMVGVSRPVVKHSFLIKDATEIPEVIKKAFYIATSGRPGRGRKRSCRQRQADPGRCPHKSSHWSDGRPVRR